LKLIHNKKEGHRKQLKNEWQNYRIKIDDPPLINIRKNCKKQRGNGSPTKSPRSRIYIMEKN